MKMDRETLSMRRRPGNGRWTLTALAAVTALIALISPEAKAAAGWLGLHPHPPRLGLILAAAPVIQIHIAGAVVALVIGTVLMIGVKGTTLHRTLGWGWVVAMALTAVSSLFIRQINHGALSFIHLLSGWTIVALPMAIYAIKRGKVAAHRRTMTGLFVGGLIIAGLLTFLPGRLMWTVFLG
jgi:uncharacterized membrane protein